MWSYVFRWVWNMTKGKMLKAEMFLHTYISAIGRIGGTWHVCSLMDPQNIASCTAEWPMYVVRWFMNFPSTVAWIFALWYLCTKTCENIKNHQHYELSSSNSNSKLIWATKYLPNIIGLPADDIPVQGLSFLAWFGAFHSLYLVTGCR